MRGPGHARPRQLQTVALVLDVRMRPLAGMAAHGSNSLARGVKTKTLPRPPGGPLRAGCEAGFTEIGAKSGSSRALSRILESHNRRTSTSCRASV